MKEDGLSIKFRISWFEAGKNNPVLRVYDA